MILVLGVWAFLRTLLGRSTAVTFENIAPRKMSSQDETVGIGNL